MGKITHKQLTESAENVFKEEMAIADHKVGMQQIEMLLVDKVYGVLRNADEVSLVGHRVVHGGEDFSSTTQITEAVKNKIKELAPLAPLHNPPNLVGIEASEKIFPNATQIGVFDTAFHQSLPEYAYRYAIPKDLYEEHGIRVYGFHGTSHRYITKRAAKLLNKPLESINLITIHLGNGASMAAVKNGKSIDTTLGLTPLPGLVMGTRSGDIDPGVLFYLNETLGYTLPEIKDLLNKESGLKGLSGENDMRGITERAEKGDKDAQLAIAVYTYRIKKYIGSYIAAIGKVDALIFTAGVGENSPVIRALSVEGLEPLGIELDTAKNQNRGGERKISTEKSKVGIWVIPTNEELEIANQTYELAK